MGLPLLMLWLLLNKLQSLTALKPCAVHSCCSRCLCWG